MLIRQAQDEAFAPEAVQVIGDVVAVVIGLSQMGSHQGTQAGIGKPVGQVTELAQAGKQGHDTGVAKAKPRSSTV